MSAWPAFCGLWPVLGRVERLIREGINRDRLQSLLWRVAHGAAVTELERVREERS